MRLFQKNRVPRLSSLLPVLLATALVTLNSFHPISSSESDVPPTISSAEIASMLFSDLDGAVIEGGAEMPCDYRSVLMATPGFMTCLNDAWIPGYKYKINWQPGAALCGPFGSWQGYIWLTFDCPPPCLGPPDLLVAEVLFCGNCSLISWSCS